MSARIPEGEDAAADEDEGAFADLSREEEGDARREKMGRRYERVFPVPVGETAVTSRA